jgi:hypothetical protein
VGIGNGSPSYNLDVTGDTHTSGCFLAGSSATPIGGTCSSDLRTKQNVEPITGALDRVLKLRPVSFEYKAQPGVRQTGFIAQEVEKVMPQLVVDDGKIKKVRYDLEIQMNMLAAIQEQESKIAALEAENHSLTERLRAIDDRLRSLEPRSAAPFSMGLGGGLAPTGAAIAGLAFLLGRRHSRKA